MKLIGNEEINRIVKFVFSEVENHRLTVVEAKNIISALSEFNLQSKEIAVIGIGCRYPQCKNKQEFWELLKNGKMTIREFPQNRKDDMHFLYLFPEMEEKLGSYFESVDKFDYDFFNITPAEAEFMDLSQRFFLETAFTALQDAGLSRKKLNNTKTGVYLGMDNSSTRYVSYINAPDSSLISGGTVSIAASRLAYYLNMNGPCLVFDSGCSSSAVALHYACEDLRHMNCDMAIAGGFSIIIAPGAKNEIIDSHNGKIQAFDQESTGMVWGEGVGAVVLKPLSKAVIDKDHIYAVIKSSSINNDGKTNGLTAPNAVQQSKVILDAWKKAGISAEDISYIETHGTGTKIGDPIEIKGIEMAFREYTNKKQFCGIGSIKSNIGHTIGASGVTSFIKVSLCINHKQLLPTINFDKPNRSIPFTDSPVYVVDKLTDWESKTKRICGLNSFGFSGTNCHFVLGESDQTFKRNIENRLSLFVLSAKDYKTISTLAESYCAAFKEMNEVDLESICYTVSVGRDHYEYRIAFLVSNIQELIKILKEIITINIKNNHIKGMHYGHHKLSTVKNNRSDYLYYDDYCEMTQKSNKIIKMIHIWDHSNNTKILMDLYVRGADVDWSVYYENKNVHTLSLPTYPLSPKRIWHDFKFINNFNKIKQTEHEPALWHFDWKEEVAPVVMPIQWEKTSIFYYPGTPLQIIMDLYNKNNIQYNTFNCLDSQMDLYHFVKEKLNYHILLILPFINFSLDQCDNYNQYIFDFIKIIKLIVENRTREKFKFNIIVPGGALLSLMHGFAKTMQIEQPNIQSKVINIESLQRIDLLLNDIYSEASFDNLSYHVDKRMVLKLKTMDKIITTKNRIYPDKSYIVMGGTGGIGMHILSYLARKGATYIAAIGNRKFPRMYEERQRYIQEKKGQLDASEYELLQQLNAFDCRIDYFSANICDTDKLKRILHIINQIKPIGGLFNSVGIVEKGFTIRKDTELIKRVLDSKVRGTMSIFEAISPYLPDFFVSFSSVATLIPSFGQSEYIAANSFMEAYLAGKNNPSIYKTVAWPTWKNTGLAKKHNVQDDAVFKAVSAEEAINILDKALNINNYSNLIVGDIDYKHQILKNIDKLPFILDESVLTNISTEHIMEPVYNIQNIDYQKAEFIISNLWKEVLKIEHIDNDISFYDVGGDSILGIQLYEKINKIFHGVINITDIYTFPTIKSMSVFITDSIVKKNYNQNYDIEKLNLEQIIDKITERDLSVDEGLDLLLV